MKLMRLVSRAKVSRAKAIVPKKLHGFLQKLVEQKLD